MLKASLALSLVRKLLIHRFASQNIEFNTIIKNHKTNFSNCFYYQDPENRKAITWAVYI